MADTYNSELELLKRENIKLKAKLEEVSSLNEHLENELSMAAKLKYHLMPNTYPAFHDVPDIDIFADSIEIKQIGGDYYDFFRIDSDHIGIVIADIFDGGTAAALYMVAFKTYLTSSISLDTSIDERMSTVNDLLCWGNADDLCLSAWYGIYEISTGIIRGVNAGHERVLLLRDKGVEKFDDEVVSYILGVVPGIEYESFEIKMERGDKLLFYTDGVTGATGKDRETYTARRLESAFKGTSDRNAEETVAFLEKDFSDFIKGAELKEDASFMCLIRGGGETDALL